MARIFLNSNSQEQIDEAKKHFDIAMFIRVNSRCYPLNYNLMYKNSEFWVLR